MTKTRKAPAMPGLFNGGCIFGLVAESNTVCNVINHVTVQADICQLTRIKFTERNLGLVLNTKGAQESKNLGYNHFITYFKPANSYWRCLSDNRHVLTEDIPRRNS
ncbi:hypothetical protein [Thalassospira alkalitolerans]|uniref:hypothetical protein n=1 Tax=Thalassospira alkalitolerans TaxID=1293890 RepID=UPI0030EC116D